MRFYPVFLILAVLTFFSACQKSRPELSNPDHFEAYISAYSGPIINRTDPILITFTAPYGKGQEEQEVTPQPVQLLPAIGGKTVWMDAYTLQFTPVNPLTSGMEYMVDLNMGQLIQGLHDTLHHFRFVVRVKDQFLRLQTEDLTIPDPASPNLFSLKGILHTNDMADPALVEACLTVRNDNQKPTIQWDHDPNGLTHRFSLSGLQQQKEDRQFTLAIDGSPLGLELNSEQQLTIPGSALFRVSQYRVEQGSQSIVHLTFSHLVDPDQDLTGLIFIREKPQLSPRFLIDANKITCYFPERLEGIYNLDVLVGVRNVQKLRLAQPYSAKTSFTQVAPQVRLAGMGMILPRSEELYFPFEAVNLEAVEVEIFKIYSNNILQFLQVNSMDGNYELQRVGKVVYRGTVDLSALNPEQNNFEWVQYALDLAPLIQRDPNALYQIRIGFWPHQTGYICDGETAISSPQTEDESGYEEGYWEQEGDIEESIMNAYWGPYGYQRDYSWENRDNPCAPEYYNSDRFISRNVLASDLGITVKMGDNGDLLTVVTDLRTADPIDGAQIEYYDAQLQRLASVKTDEHGMVLGRLKTYPDFVVVRSRESTGYLALRKNDGLSASDFETAGVAVQKGLRGYPYAERGVWRPGDSIFLHLILHDPEKTLPLNYPVSMEVFDPRGRLAYKTVNAEPTGAIYPFTFATLPDAPTGTWHAKFMAGGATFHHYLRVETIKPNRLKLKLDFGKDRLSAQNEPIQATLQANWLHDTPAKHQAVQIEASAHHVKPVFKKFEGYNFTHEEHLGENFSGSVWVEGRTDEKGTCQIADKELLGNRHVPGQLRFDFKFRVDEPGGGFSQDFRSIPYDPYTSYCGIKIPRNQYGAPSFGPNEPVTISFACVDPTGKPVAGRTLTVKKVRMEWRWWWERYRDNRMDYNQDDSKDIREEKTVTTNSQGIAEWKLTFQEYSRYLIEVCDPESGHCAGGNIYIYDRSSPANKDSRYFSFSTDRDTYQPGDEVQINLPGATAGKALISVENGSGILEAHLIPLKPDQTTYKIAVTRAMKPNVYLHVALIQPHDQANRDLPLRLYSIQSIQIQDPDSHLQPIVTAPAEMRPDQRYPITVKEQKGKPMAYTLALVDEGLLDLTRFPTPDPYKHIYSKEALGVSTWDIYDQVLGGYGGELRRIIAIGGDGAAGKPEGSPKANRFKPAIVHLGPFQLKRGQTATHQVSIDNYVGQVRLMVVAAGDLAYGQTEKSIPIRKPLMTVATLPRQLGIRETLNLPVTVFAMDKKIRNVEVTVRESSGLVRFTKQAKASLQFSGPDDQTVYFPLVVSDRSGIARFTIEVKGNGESASQQIEIDVRNPNPYQTTTHSQLVKPGQSATFNVPLIGTPGTNTVVLEGFTLPPAQVTKHLNTLMNYGFGCLEQTTSKVFPLLYIPYLADIPEPAARDIRDRVSAGIQRILSMKDGAGRLTYWPRGNYHHMWSEIYATLFLNLAKQEGYVISESSLKSIMTSHKRLANEWSASKKILEEYGHYSHTLQAFRLFMLAISGEPQLGAMNRLMEEPQLPELERWLLASAYARAGKTDVSKRIVAGLGNAVSIYRDSRVTFGSDVRDLGLIVIAMQDIGDRVKGFATLKKMADLMNSNRWYSTHSLAVGLWAYASYARTVPKPENLSLTYALANGTKKQMATNLNMLKVGLPPGDVNKQKLVVTNTSKSEMYIQLSLTGKPDISEEKGYSRGISLDVAYRMPNGESVNYKRIARGTDFFATARIAHLGASGEMLTEVALEQIIPTGWEIRNLRMDQMQITKLEQSSSKYQDVKDDRVNHFLDLAVTLDEQNKRIAQVYTIALTAAYPGRFYLPAQKVEAMYNPDFSALIPGGWVEVYDPILESD